ncbi:MAG: S9 family peptidase [Candidatus Krumholzibacteria bacterium]|nr:S9 family peptidase [Candidatus Krumholzibacteria bacterium]
MGPPPRRLLAILLIPALTGCAEQGVRRYAIEQFLNTVSVDGGAFSHDETRLLVSTDETGIYNAYSISLADGGMRQLTWSKSNSIFALSYFPRDDRFLCLADEGGNEIYHIFLYDTDGTATDLTPYDGSRCVFHGWTRDERSFMFGSNRRDARYMDVYLMDIETFAPKMIFLNDAGYNIGWISNDMRYLSLHVSHTTHDSDIFIYDRDTGSLVHVSPHEGEANFEPMDFSVDSRHLYYLTDSGAEFMYLRRYDIEAATHETVEQAAWDISYAYFSYDGRYRVTAINNDGSTEVRVRDMKADSLVELPALPEGVIHSVGISRSERLMRFVVNGSRSPSNIYVYDFDTKAYRRLTDTLSPEIDPDDLVDAKVVRYSSFDGIEIPAIYYEPHGAGQDDPVPGVVYVHGGPGGQSKVVYSSVIQYLVNHGYAVLAVNNRGSSGYGKEFFSLDDRRHGEDDLRDCIEGKNWLGSTGKVDPDRVAILGASYGGYMVLAALAFAPEEFAAGVDMFGISNWVRTLESIPPYWESYRKALYRELGDPATDREYLMRISPLFHADRIVRPLMVLQGANDPRVLRVEADEIVEAARTNGVEAEYIVFDDEGHGFLKKKNKIEGYRAVRKFLDRHLK